MVLSIYYLLYWAILVTSANDIKKENNILLLFSQAENNLKENNYMLNIIIQKPPV